MDERHEPKGRSIIGTGAVVVGLCVAAFLVPDAWLDRVSGVFGTTDRGPDAFTDDIARLDAALESGEKGEVAPDLVPFIAARRLTKTGPMTADEVAEAARIWRATADGAVVDEYTRRFPRLDPSRVQEEVDRLRGQLGEAPPGASPTGTCSSCHRETRELPSQATFDVRGIYPFGSEAPEFDGGRRVPWLTDAIELDAYSERTGEQRACGDCHVGHGEPDFAIGRAARIKNMGLWVNVEPSDPNVLHVEVKVKNSASGHRVPAGPGSPAYVVTVETRQHRERLPQRFGSRLPEQLRSAERDAGAVFARDFRDADSRATSDPARIANLVADTRLESGRFQQLDFLFDRVDRSTAHLDVVLWYLPDVTTWEGARAIRRASKPESID